MISYDELIALPRLVQAWEVFRKGKTNKRDVQLFTLHLEDNLFTLYQALKRQTYRHGGYEAFWVHDPKRRHIHKACVTDRVVHHLFYTYLYELFDSSFISDSYSCRLEKGTHRGVARLMTFARKESANYTRDCWVLQFDIKQFFASADHNILKRLLAKKISDERILDLLSQVIDSFASTVGSEKGIPLGNLTSQIFANMYLHELDIYMKHILKARFYIRYADDGVVLSSFKQNLIGLILPIEDFLQTRLLLSLHPRKVTVRKLSWGIDFLGYIVLPHYVLPRTRTKRRLLTRIRTGVLTRFSTRCIVLLISLMDQIPNLSDRQLQILKAIIEEYISTAEPVGSETLDKKYNLGVSPATIRNEMVRLTDLKLLMQSHTSAGRTPTPVALKYYVTNLMKTKDLSVADEVAVKEKIWDYRQEVDKLLREATKILAEKTKTLAVTATGDGDLYYAGAANILDMPEFYDYELTHHLLSALDRFDFWWDLLEAHEDPFYILLGEEFGARSNLSACGYVYTKFKTPHLNGAIGVVGPSRLNYPYVIPVVRYLGGLIDEMGRSW